MAAAAYACAHAIEPLSCRSSKGALHAMRGKSFMPLLAVLYGSAFLAGFNENLVNTALISIMAEYDIDSIAAQWLVTGYMIVATVVVTTMAFLYRRIRLRTLFFGAAAFSLVGSVLGFMAPNFPLLLVARLVQAVGTGVFIPMMMNTVLVVAPARRLGTYMSIGSCMITFGPAFAPVVCGSIVTALGWRFVFAVPAVCTAALLVLGFAFVKNLENQPAHLDVPSVALSALALFTLSFGLAQLSADTMMAIASLAVCAASAVAFVVRQMRCKHPLIDLAPMRRITFWPTMLLLVVAMMSTFSLSVLLPQHLEGSLGMTAFASGAVMLVPVLLNTGVTLVAGRLFDRMGEWPLLPIGYLIAAVGFVVLAVSAPSLSLVFAIVGALLIFGGVGLVFSPTQTAGLRTLPPEENAFGVSLSTTFVQVAACIGPSLFTGVMASAQSGAYTAGASAQLASAYGFSAAAVVAAAIAFAGSAGAFAYALSARRRRANEKSSDASKTVEGDAARPADRV